MTLKQHRLFQHEVFMSSKVWWSTSSGRIELRVRRADALDCSVPGMDADDAVTALLKRAYIRAQMSALDPEIVRAELREYGAWDEAELRDVDANQKRLLWLACGDIREGNI
jgi:hypothetical protein